MSHPTTPADAALDALAAALAPRVLRLLREQAGEADDDIAELLARSGFELDVEATSVAKTKPAPAPRKGCAA